MMIEFSNPNLTEQDILVIQSSMDDMLVLAHRFSLNPIDVKVIQDARPGSTSGPIMPAAATRTGLHAVK